MKQALVNTSCIPGTRCGVEVGEDKVEAEVGWSVVSLLDPACGLEQLQEWDEKGSCFTKTWDTAAKRRKLWCVCNRSQYWAVIG